MAGRGIGRIAAHHAAHAVEVLKQLAGHDPFGAVAQVKALPDLAAGVLFQK